MKNLTHSRWMLLLTIVLITGLLLPERSDAQMTGQPEPDERRFSITLNGGVTYATTGQGTLGPLAGEFNVPSYQRHVYGGSIQYAISPTWSIETALHVGEFENQFEDDPFFRNEYLHVAVRGITNLNNLFNIRWGAARVFNPYLALGLGMMHSDIIADDLDSRSLSLMATGGAGISFYLARWADLFVQYDYYVVGDDLLDGFSGPGGTDQFAAVSGGLRFNFGSGNTRLASWPAPLPPAPDPVAEVEDPEPQPEPEPEPEPVPEVITLDESTQEWLTGLTIFLRSPQMNRPAGLDEARARAIARVEQRREEERRARERIFTERPGSGQYVQVYSLQSRESAERAREAAIRALEGIISNPDRRVIIHLYDGFHRVLIGPFAEYRQAQSVLREISGDYEDGFVITFPRE